jgi:ATP-dependent DNA ligase
LLKEQEFVVGGYTEPEGIRQYFGSLVVGFYRGKELVFAGKVGTGLIQSFCGASFLGSKDSYVSRVLL